MGQNVTSDFTSAPFDWLVRMRWLAIAGQIVAIGTAVLAFRAPLDILGLGCAILVAISANLFVYTARPFLLRHAYATVAALLALDTLLLTALLLLSGGLHNPFTSFFLLHITLATIMLNQRHAAILTALAFLCIFAIYRFPYSDPHSHHWISMEMHFAGMMLTLFLTGAFILFFVGRLQKDLQLQQRLLQANELKLARQQRVIGLATLAAGVAHELATPLSTIAVASHELRLTAGQFCMNKSCLSDSQLIRQEVDRCRAIIDRLSAGHTNPGSGPLNLTHEFLNQALVGYLPANCHARLTIDCPEPVPIESDEVALFQSLGALIKNGCEADESGGPVTLRVERLKGGVRIRVEDRGGGIASEVLQRLGEPFVTTKEPGKGIGLGLYLVHMFCLLNGGTIRYDSGGDRIGTQVELELPGMKAV